VDRSAERSPGHLQRHKRNAVALRVGAARRENEAYPRRFFFCCNRSRSAAVVLPLIRARLVTTEAAWLRAEENFPPFEPECFHRMKYLLQRKQNGSVGGKTFSNGARMFPSYEVFVTTEAEWLRWRKIFHQRKQNGCNASKNGSVVTNSASTDAFTLATEAESHATEAFSLPTEYSHRHTTPFRCAYYWYGMPSSSSASRAISRSARCLNVYQSSRRSASSIVA
jgi:hypothetical protein